MNEPHEDIQAAVDATEILLTRINELKHKWGGLCGRELALAATKTEEVIHRLRDAIDATEPRSGGRSVQSTGR